jgi:hypothetical protein
MTQNFSSFYQFRKTGSGQFLPPGQVILSPGLAKIAPWWLARRDSLSAKAPGLIVGVSAPPTLTAYTREPLCGIARGTKNCHAREFIMTLKFRPSTRTYPSGQFYHDP